MTEIRYSHETPAARSTVLHLGPYARAAYRVAAPPDPEDARVIRPTHQIGRITARGGRPASKAPSACDHSKFRAWRHDDYRLRCSGCKQPYNKSGAVA